MRVLNAVVLVVAATHAFVHVAAAQTPDHPKASKGEVDQVIASIRSEPAKLQRYCTIIKAQDEIARAVETKDDDKVVAETQRIVSAVMELGPEFRKVTSSELDDDAAQALSELSLTCSS